jgi:SSS family solute:Na+ symporter/sodium/proline symporter
LFSPATNLVNDVFVRYIKPEASNKEVLLISRLMVVGLGAWALYQSLGTASVLNMSLYAYTIYASALTPVVLAAFFWKRATAAGAVASIAAGTAITVAWDSLTPHLPVAIGSYNAILPALLASLLCLFVVSLATKRPSEQQLAPFAS